MSQSPTPSSAGAAESHSAFALLHRGVQRVLYAMQWAQLRPLQVRAIRHVLQSDRDAILSAATAAGKTEAAFLPVLSRIADEGGGSVRALYVGPLKALINDQFQRIEDLCEHLDIPVFRWHGDVAAAHKKALVEKPGGVLLITPESLESLFINRSPHLGRILGGLRFIVIDELHAFLATERGLHLRSLLQRLMPIPRDGRPRLLGLSATIGDTEVAKRCLRPDDPSRVDCIDDAGGDKELKLRVHGYRRSEKDAEAVDRRLATNIIQHCEGHSNLLFANAKADVEGFADLCQHIAKDAVSTHRFLVHHGSLSANIREDTEQTMKEGRQAATTFCSSTLEMGIDIGSVRMVGQIGAPWAVSSFKQRIGHSGRRDGEARIARVYIQCDDPSGEDDLFKRLHLELLQAAAVTDLMLEGWVEPDKPVACDLSTLTQQIISVVAQHGGAKARDLFETLCRPGRGAFDNVDAGLFAKLLQSLADRDIIEQAEPGDEV